MDALKGVHIIYYEFDGKWEMTEWIPGEDFQNLVLRKNKNTLDDFISAVKKNIGKTFWDSFARDVIKFPGMLGPRIEGLFQT
jgi:hypothetical protein